MNQYLTTPDRAYSQMLEEILAWLRSGKLAVGDRLPTESQLAERYGISITSVRRGVELLVEEGLVVRRQGSGTYFASQPPMPAPTRRSTVLVGWEWDYTAYHPYYTEMLLGVRQALDSRGWQVDDMLRRPTDEAANDDGFRKAVPRYVDPELVVAATRGRHDVAGLVVSAPLAQLMAERISPPLPTVALSAVSDFPFVVYNWRWEVSRAIEAVLDCGARRVAVFTNHGPTLMDVAVARARRAADSSADVTVYRLSASHVTSLVIASAYQTAMEVLGAPGERPDGIVVTDDFSSQGVLDALAAAGVDPLPIVCMVNRESRIRTSLPLMRLISDGHAVGMAAGELLDQLLRLPYEAPREIVLTCSWAYDPGAQHPKLHGWEGLNARKAPDRDTQGERP